MEIVNVVASTKINGTIAIEKIFPLLKNAKYEPNNFAGLIYRKKYTIIMFHTGKIQSQGTNSISKAKIAIEETIEEINAINGIIGSIKHPEIKISNIVAVDSVNTNIDIERISDEYNVMYEPEQFPGIIYKPFNNSVTCLLFSSGKIVIVGSKNTNEIKEARDSINHIIS